MDLKDAALRISKLLVLSYIIDWIFIMKSILTKGQIHSGIALIGYGFSKVTPNHHAFSLTDPSISYPYTENETVTTETLILAGLFAPAVIVLLGALLLIPGTAAAAAVDGTKPSVAQILRRKIWEWNAGWMGLAVALAGVWTSTQGLKDLIGKPRPDLLARCDPDLSTLAQHTVSGLGKKVAGAPVLVSWEICRNQASFVKVDGFSSFPSGHSSFAFAGLTYLTLWLCSKFSVGFPYLPPYPVEDQTHSDDRASVRKRGAAPPVLLMLLAFVPFATACFIAASRWFNYRHHGFDILFGSTMGVLFGWIGFRMYHLPIRRGAGWAWGARSRKRAFLRGIGVPSSLGTDNWAYPQNTDLDNRGNTDVENAPSAHSQPPNSHVKTSGSSANGARLEV
ncbi:hypothetical protein NUU61_007723 [Penicillium alfredii]|uniref:Phosphatidic acid phosphatase type 2/haloperoxidase domain-containing protein n=1 Tax=Penicillium alfredii TaxID=1506179 RepID=A0A9W9JYU5_9EURO|nr:uncharacterized protein NUU61_007723 [Penicillium alfredii]KAJ5086416.1 hypothetical protein NUU61_007723 [Penicillium alfredii]